MPNKKQERKEMVERISYLLAKTADEYFDGAKEPAFLLWAMSLALEQTDDPPSQEDLVSNITDGPNDLGLDGYFLDQGERTLYLFQGKFSTATTTIPREPVADFLGLPNRLSNFETLIHANTKVVEFAPIFKEAATDGFQLHFVYLDCRENTEVLTQEIQTWAEEELVLSFDAIPVHIPHTATILDGRELLTRFESANSLAPIDIQLRVPANEWHISEDGHVRTLIASIRATDLAEVFDAHRFAIFRFNPRGPLGSVTVNQRIKGSLRSTAMRPWFLAMNNGLAAVCESVGNPVTQGDSDVFAVSDFQIVNGCQTTYNIWDHKRRNGSLDQVKVSLKLVAPETVRDVISHASNQQNQMKDWDFLFDDDIQKRLQSEFRVLTPKLFYELRRGEYKYVMPDPSAERVTIKDIAQPAWAFLGYPGEAKDKIREVAQSKGIAGGAYQKLF